MPTPIEELAALRKPGHKNPLIIKDGRLGIGIDIGWRITCKDGVHDMIWGNTRDDTTLGFLLVDVERRFGRREIIDERTSRETD